MRLREVSFLRLASFGNYRIAERDPFRPNPVSTQIPHSPNAQPVHYKCAVAHSIIVDDRASSINVLQPNRVKNHRSLDFGNQYTTRINEHKCTGLKAKINVNAGSDNGAIVFQSDTGFELRSRWQRRPADRAGVGDRDRSHWRCRCRIAPGNPRWTPIITRSPSPPDRHIVEPTAVMEDDFAPGIIRFPKPSIFSVCPVPVVNVRSPRRIRLEQPRHPARAIRRDVPPIAVVLQFFFEILEIDRVGRGRSGAACRGDDRHRRIVRRRGRNLRRHGNRIRGLNLFRLDHRQYDLLRHPQTIEAQNIVRAKIVNFVGLLDIEQNGVVAHVRLGKFDDLLQVW